MSGSTVGDFDMPSSNKKAKLIHSPLLDRKECNKVFIGSGFSIPLLSTNSSQFSSGITANFAILAVITFYSAFQYLDQWPPPLVKA